MWKRTPNHWPLPTAGECKPFTPLALPLASGISQKLIWHRCERASFLVRRILWSGSAISTARYKLSVITGRSTSRRTSHCHKHLPLVAMSARQLPVSPVQRSTRSSLCCPSSSPYSTARYSGRSTQRLHPKKILTFRSSTSRR